jgi:hypothetical protein
MASYLCKTFVLTWSAGIEGSIWYALDNATYGTLYDTTNGFSDAATAFKITRKWLEGAYMRGPVTVSGTSWSCDLVREGGYTAKIIWDTSGSANYTVPVGFTQYRDLSGERFACNPGDVIAIDDSPRIFESSNLLGVMIVGYILSVAQKNKLVWDTARDGALPPGNGTSYVAAAIAT